MLMPLSGLLGWWWCFCCCCAWYRCGSCAPAPQMLRHQGLLKCRCRMLFNDLKVFLLRRPPPAPLPMHGDPQPPSLAANNNTLPALGAGGCAGWRGPREGVGRETTPLPPPPPLPPSSVEDDWGGPATEPPTSLLSSASSDDFCKGKAEDCYSLGSSLDSGMRTPLCRICFQGPEQGELLSPCRCDGSVKCTHQPCLIKWISERGCWSCELCYYKYHVIAISTKNPLQESLRVRTFAVESLSANPMEGKGREEDLKLDSGGASPTFALAVGLQSRGFLEKPVQQPEMSFCCQNTFERRACLAENAERI
ncbi:E3 ubiquitin-protein ligase MARCH4-like [Leptonychotes weddellii]|uniref:RING-type E3 ubiquitin transferase n=1 Tax=Leptonychotes weddellii TaxID=9713 RepID=A0A2U3YQM0_LEPWE|nr:E3 ubiquitin-protein ligase MARCH4-like [Leptonychotes weddellii]